MSEETLKKLAQYVLLIGLPLVIAAYAAEYWLWHKADTRLVETAKRNGIPHDARTKIEVVRDLRAAGKRADLYVPPETLFRGQGAGYVPALKSADGTSWLQPLGGISGSENVVCNESGAWFSFPSDRHGFNNPDSVWDRDRIDVLALGDSFTLGNCAPRGKGMVDLIGGEFPATLNLGAGGNGPLIQLAGLREYGAKYRPKVILWFFFANDLQNLANEEVHIVLNRYRTDPGFSQNLAARQGEIDAGLRKITEPVIAGQSTEEGRFFRMMRLQMLRYTLVLPGAVQPPGLVGRYVEILQNAQATAQKWGGKIIFVYLPQAARFYVPDDRSVVTADRRRAEIFSPQRWPGAKIIELATPFAAAPDPKALFYGPTTHYSEAEYALAAKVLIPEIRKSLAAR